MKRDKYRIGLLIDYIISDYSASVIQGVRNACIDFDMELIIFTIGELHSIRTPFEYQALAITALVNRNNLDGIIMTSGTQMHYLSKSELETYVKSYNPLPVINIAVEIPQVPSIIVKAQNAYRFLITELVKNQGCKKFGVLAVRGNSQEARERISFIKEALKENNIPDSDVTFLMADFDYDAAYNELYLYYENCKTFNFDALLTLNDEMAFACMEFCNKLKLNVPQDIVVAGFDDVLRDTFSSPTLTSISQDIPAQGYSAVLALRDCLEGRGTNMLKVIDAKVLLRESTCRNGYSEALQKDKFVTIDMDNENLGNKKNASEWFTKRNQFLYISRFFTETQTLMSTSQLRARINQDLKRFGITACAIVIYEQPIEMVTPFDYFNLPHKAELFSAFDYGTGFESTEIKKKIKFDPNDGMVPENILKFDSFGMYAMALFHETLQYGYMLYRSGDYDSACYDLLTKITSAIVSSCYQFTLVHNEQNKEKHKSKKLNVIAHTDELTGLLNRRGLYEMGQNVLKMAKSMGQSGIIVYCDMDGLKKINDSFGHEAGDRAIAAEGSILKANFRLNDVVSRIGGDEFAIISPGLTPESFIRIKNNIDEDCKKWSKDNKCQYDIGISMGFISYPSDSSEYSITSLLAEADSKLYEEKHLKKGINNLSEYK